MQLQVYHIVLNNTMHNALTAVTEFMHVLQRTQGACGCLTVARDLPPLLTSCCGQRRHTNLLDTRK